MLQGSVSANQDGEDLTVIFQSLLTAMVEEFALDTVNVSLGNATVTWTTKGKIVRTKRSVQTIVTITASASMGNAIVTLDILVQLAKRTEYQKKNALIAVGFVCQVSVIAKQEMLDVQP